MVLDTCAARLVGLYNKLITDVGRDNGIVIKLQQAAAKAAIDDPRVPPGPAPRWNVVLRYWSTTIMHTFDTANALVPRPGASQDEVLRLILHLANTSAKKITSLEEDHVALRTLIEDSRLQSDSHLMALRRVETLEKELKASEKSRKNASVCIRRPMTP